MSINIQSKILPNTSYFALYFMIILMISPAQRPVEVDDEARNAQRLNILQGELRRRLLHLHGTLKPTNEGETDENGYSRTSYTPYSILSGSLT